MRAVRDYPWHALEHLSRRSVRSLRRLRRLFSRDYSLSQTLGELTGTEVEIVLRHVGRARGASAAREIVLKFVPSGAHVGVSLEPDGVHSLLARALGRPLGLTRPEADLGSTLSGAAAALALEVARRLSTSPVELESRVPDHEPWEVEATLLLEGQPFAARIRAWVESDETAPSPDWAPLGDARIELPLVVALSTASRGELSELAVGDAWFPGAGWWIDRALEGRAVLAGGASERGISVELPHGGAVVLRGEAVDLALESATGREAAEVMSSSENKPETSLAEVVLEAPVVVRVELGSVSLSAAEVTSLRPGDVLETGRKLAEPVVLRVAGKAIARGDLVDVEGELGVRIRELVGGES